MTFVFRKLSGAACGHLRRTVGESGARNLQATRGMRTEMTTRRLRQSTGRQEALTTDQPKNAVIVGGGIAGLFAGLVLARAGKHLVHLVERDTRVGGLLRSTQYRGGFSYDTGIHYAVETGNPEIDSILFEGMTEDNWHVFTTSLPQGNVFGGRLNRDSGCIDARMLATDLQARGLVEILDGRAALADVPHLAEELEAEYGPTYTEHIYRPVMRKLAGHELEQLAPGAHGRFGISRLIVLPSRATKRLKTLPEYDKCIGYTKTHDGRSSIRKFYPRDGGIGMWPEMLALRLTDTGARIHTATTIDAVTTDNGRITSVTFSDGQVLPCDLLVWTVPLPLLARALGTVVSGTAPVFRHVLLLHYLFKRGVTPDLHWISIYDEGAVSYRVTLYDNIAPGNDPNGSRLTVETLWSEYPKDIEKIFRRVGDELGDLGLVEDARNVVFMGHEWIANAFPVQLSGCKLRVPRPSVIDDLTNLVAAGRGADTTFSQPNILESVLSEVRQHVAV